MSRRIYWLLPDVPSARDTMVDLLVAGVPWRRMHFVARDGADLTGLHAAGVLQTSDLVRAAETGLVIGVALGGVVGVLAALILPGPGEPPQWLLVPALMLAGAILDAWTASLIGISLPNRRLKRFAADIEQGRVVLMVDLPQRHARPIEARLRALHPQPRPQARPRLPLARPA